MMERMAIVRRRKKSVWVACIFLAFVMGLTAQSAYGRKMLAPTPPMGWNAWNIFGGEVSEEKIKGIADAMVASGMKDAGYQYVVIDDVWHQGRVKGFSFAAQEERPGRDENGVLLADPVKFPQGMKAVGDYIHSKGLKFGIYTGPGYHTCASCPASEGHEAQDIQTFVEWGVDFIKLDWCGQTKSAREILPLWRKLLDECGRDIVLSVNAGNDYVFLQTMADMYRTTPDIHPVWDYEPSQFRYMCSIVDIIDFQLGLEKFHGPGHWCDPDMLQVGNGSLTEAENRAHFGMWAIMAAPLIAGNDLRNMTESTRRILTNREVIAVDQDPAGRHGVKLRDYKPGLEVWAKPLADKRTIAVALLNRTRQPAEMAVSLADLGIQGKAHARDLWQSKDIGHHKEVFKMTVGVRDVAMIKFTASEPLGDMVLYSNPVPVEGRLFEIEDDAHIVQGGRVDAYHWGFTGSGHAMGGQNLWRTFNPTWMVEAAQDGLYRLEIRYSNGMDRPIPAGVGVCGLDGVDGKEVVFPATKNWADWQTLSLELRLWKGWNRVLIDVRDVKNNDLAIDWLRVTPMGQK